MADPIIVVSGLPRSGTSLMMQMLASGGLEAVTDNIRTPTPTTPAGITSSSRSRSSRKTSPGCRPPAARS